MLRPSSPKIVASDTRDRLNHKIGIPKNVFALDLAIDWIWLGPVGEKDGKDKERKKNPLPALSKHLNPAWLHLSLSDLCITMPHEITLKHRSLIQKNNR